MSIKILTANFTIDGIPLVGLTPVVSIYHLHPTNPLVNNLIVSNGVTTEVGAGWYRYEFIGYDVTNNYVFSFDGGIGVPVIARYQHGANDVNSADSWDEPALDHLQTGSLGYVITQTKADTATILTSSIPNLSAQIADVPSTVRANLSTELAHLTSLQNGLTPSQATMLIEIYTMYGLDPTKPLVVDLNTPSNGTRTFGDIDQSIQVVGNKTTVTRIP